MKNFNIIMITYNNPIYCTGAYNEHVYNYEGNLNLLDHVVPPSSPQGNKTRKESDILKRITIIRYGTVFFVLYIISRYLKCKHKMAKSKISSFNGNLHKTI